MILVHSERYNEYRRRQVALPQSEGAKKSILMIVCTTQLNVCITNEHVNPL